jgi:arginine N-succinyltransferase
MGDREWLLPPEAREVIGRCHAQGVGALKLLEWEGFRFERVVDIFDGGPLVKCERQNIRTVRESRLVTLTVGSPSEESEPALVSSDRLPDFRVVSVPVEMTGEETAVTDAEVFEALQIKPGEQVRIWTRSEA